MHMAANGLAAEGPGASRSTRWKVGVMGITGRGNYGHGLDTVWLRVPEAEIAGVSDPDAGGLAAAQKRLNVRAGFGDFREMLERVKPDLVSVASRYVDGHFEMIKAAIEHGVRGIYVEKPFVRTSGEGRAILALARERGAKVAIAHRNRYHPALPEALRLIRSGVLGRPLEIRGRGKEDARGGGQDLWVLGSHLLNLVPVFAGTPEGCSASIFEKGREATASDSKEGDEGIGLILGDEIHARFDTASGVPFFFSSKKNAGDKSAGFGLQVICSEGIISVRMDAEPMIHVRRGNPFLPSAETASWEVVSSGGLGKPEPIENIKELVAGHIAPVRDLIESITTDRQPLCGAADGLSTIRMIESVFESHRQGGGRVKISS